MSSQVASQRAEEAVIGALLASPELAQEVVAAGLEGTHIFYRPYRLVFDELIEASYRDEPMDAIVVAEKLGPKLAAAWNCTERESTDRLMALSMQPLGVTASIRDHAAIVKQHADRRALKALAAELEARVEAEEDDPEAIASIISQKAMQIATSTALASEIYSHEELGRRWVGNVQQRIAAREAGIEIGVYTGYKFIDNWTKGLRPTELVMCGAAAGEGKSALWWGAARAFAMRQQTMQMRREAAGDKEDRRIGTLIINGEMGEEPASDRTAQTISGIEGSKLREGTLSREELAQAARLWALEKDLPLYTIDTGYLRESQLMALVSEANRKGHNVGLVIIDHFRLLRTDDRSLKGIESDEALIGFLKMRLAMELNVVVVCLGHTVKGGTEGGRRPTKDDLRGSGMIQAYADFICMLYRPWKYATDAERARGDVTMTQAELIWDKSRHSGESAAEFYLNLAQMTMRDD